MFPKNFLSGLEEIFARVFGFLAVSIVFLVFVYARGFLNLDWYSTAGLLSLFWILYELLSYILFLLFAFFSKKQEGFANQNQAPSNNKPETSQPETGFTNPPAEETTPEDLED